MPRCGEQAKPGKARCVKHYREYERERSARRREATKGIFETKRWAMRRKQVFERDPFCADGCPTGSAGPAPRRPGHLPLRTELDVVAVGRKPEQLGYKAPGTKPKSSHGPRPGTGKGHVQRANVPGE